MTRRLVVVGASLAGLRAVESARKNGFDGRITLLGAEPHLPYDRPPLSKQYLDGDAEDLAFRSEDFLVTELGAELVLGIPATRLDTIEKVVEAGAREFDYDSLVIATGSKSRAMPGVEHLTGVHTLRTLDDAKAIRAALDAGARTVVVGAGFIGSEVASAARKRGLAVTIVETLPTPLVRAVGAAMGEACALLHSRNGTELLCGAGVEAIGGSGHVEWVRLTDGTVLPADLVVVGIGADPSTDWLRGSGLALDNGVVCDEHLAAGVTGVYAAGDVARWYNPLFERHMRLEHWSSAAEQGIAAGTAAVSLAQSRPYQTVPYFWSDWYGTRIQFAGVTDADQVEVVIGDVESGRFVALYRSADRVTGVLAMNSPAEIMKFRASIARRTPWGDALIFAAHRRSLTRQERHETHV